ncbi:MAG: hypothetical protein ABJA98_10555, partial [Acidobacteriota bacterium]
MQWTIGKKLYSCLGLLGIVIMLMITGGMYSQRQIGRSIEELSAKAIPNLQRAADMKFLAEAYRSANRYNVILAAQRDSDGLGKNRKKMDGLHAQFNQRAEELGDHTGLEDVRNLAEQAVAGMNDFDAKCMEIARLSAAFKASDAAAQIPVAAASGNKVQAIEDKIAERLAAQMTAVEADAGSQERRGTTILASLAMLQFLVLGLAAYVVRTVVRTLTNASVNLRSGGEQVSSAAGQVAASAQTLSQGATEQAASLEETSASMEEMASMTRQ